MAKKTKTFVPLSQMSKRDKILHFLKLFAISFAGVIGVFAGVALYVWATGGFNPPYEPLTTWAFSQSEYVIDGNKYIDTDDYGNQKFENGNLVFVQEKDDKNELVYEYIMLVPNEGCTELDATIKISNSSNPNKPVIQFVEDENTKVLETDEEVRQDGLHETYSVKINSPIYIQPVTEIINDDVLGVREVNVGGWVMLTATQGLMQTSCWVFVDTPVEKLVIDFDNSNLLDVSAEDEDNLDNLYYNIEADASIKLNSTTYPSNSIIFPKTNVPSSKVYNEVNGTTGFLGEKVIKYETSDKDLVEIDANGNIILKQKKYGATFYVDATIVSRYVDINNIPDVQDFENGDPSQSASELYKRAMNKLVVRAQRLYFKINDIRVTGISTYTNFTNSPHKVFESATINFSNSIQLSDVRKNNYFVDLTLSDSSNAAYKNQLYDNIKLVAVYEGEPVNFEELENEEELNGLESIAINGNKIVLADSFIQVEKINGEWKYVVRQYALNNFYFMFYYETDDEIFHTEIPFTISKIDSEIITNTSSLYLTLNENGTSTPLTLDSQVAYLASNQSTYQDMKYFVPVPGTTEPELVLTSNKNLKIKIGEVEYVAVSVLKSGVTAEGDDDYVYNSLVAQDIGKTNMIAVVLREMPVMDENGQITYEPIINDGYRDFECYSDNIMLNIVKDVRFDEPIVDMDNSEGINSNPTSHDDTCAIYKEIYKNGSIRIELPFNGEEEDVNNGKLVVEPLIGSDETVAEATNYDVMFNSTIQSNVFVFEILAKYEGVIKFSVIYKTTETSLFTIGIKVLPIDLIGIELSGESTDIELTFTGTNGLLTDYSWGDLTLEYELNSPKSTASCVLAAYQAPYDESILENIDLYKGASYNQVIDGLNENVNTIAKLVGTLNALTENDVIIFKNAEDILPEEKGGKITIGDYIFNYVFNTNYVFDSSFEAHLIIMLKSTDGIYSNPLLITVKIPEIYVTYGSGNSQIVYSQGDLVTVEDVTTTGKVISIYQAGTSNRIEVRCNIGGTSYMLDDDLVFFTFENNYTTSTKSGAIIEDGAINFADVSSEIANTDGRDVIVLHTTFGYLNTEFYTYIIKPDYKFTNKKPNEEYLTPGIANLFGEFDGSYIYVTNAEFNASSTTLTNNKLFLPYGYQSDILEVLGSIDPNDSSEFLNKFYYADRVGETAYYHIYCILEIMDSKSDGIAGYKDYEPVDNKTIKLNYCESPASVLVYLKTPGNYQIKELILKTEPGVLSKFDRNNAIVASSVNDDTEVDLLNKLDFTDNAGNALTVGSDFGVIIKDVDFVVASASDKNLHFFKTSNGAKVVGYYMPDEYEFINQLDYNGLTEEQRVGYKSYYVVTEDDIIEEGKDYFTKNIDGEFVAAPGSFESGNIYYEIVYSKQAFYKSVEEYYVPLDATELGKNYLGSYYIKNSQNKFELATEFDPDNYAYYYKCEYQQIEENNDITNSYYMYNVNLIIAKDGSGNVISCCLKAENIADLDYNLNLTLSMDVVITNAGEQYKYNGLFNYVYTFVGYKN